MKKIALLLSFIFSITIIYAQAINNFPWHDDFSTHINGAGTQANGWSCSPNVSNQYSWRIIDGSTPSGNTGPLSGNGAAANDKYIYAEASTYNNGDIAYLLSPEFDIDATATSAEVSFYYYRYGSTIGDLEVDIYDGINYINLQTLSGEQQFTNNAAWIQSTIDLSAYIGQVVRIRFKGICGANFRSDIAIDDFEFNADVACPGTNNESVTNVTNSSVKLKWTESGNANSWDIEYGAAGFTQGTGTTIANLLSLSKVINGLSSSTDYEWYVHSNCVAGGMWSGPFAFTTHGNITVNVPWSEDLENMANIGNNIYPTGMAGNHYVSVSSVAPYFYAASGSKYLSPYGPYTKDTLYSPPINLVMNTSYDLSFKFRKKDNSSPRPSRMKIAISNSKTGTPFTYLKTIEANNIDDSYSQARVSYTPTTSEAVYFIIILEDYSGFQTFCLDDFKVETTPSCVPPYNYNDLVTGISTASFYWSQHGGANNWQIEYKRGADFTPGTGAADVSLNINGFPSTSTTGLIHDSYYYWYIRTDCGAGNSSDWMGRGVFKTDDGHLLGVSPSNGATSVPVTSRSFDWLDNDEADSYTISIGTAPGATDIVNNAACPISEYTYAFNWQTQTTYYWTVHTIYNGGNNTIINQERSFTTECSIINAFPFSTGFENGIPDDCWFIEDVNGVNGDWTQASSIVNFYSLPPHSGSFMAKFNSNTVAPGTSTRIYTPQLDFNALVNPEVNFWMFYEPTSSSANDRVQVQINAGAGWVNLGAPIARYGSGYGWINHYIDLSAYANQIVRIGFLGISDQGKQMYIDDILIHETPACREPYDLMGPYGSNYHSRSLQWKSPAGTNAWQIEYGFAGFAQGTGTIINTSSVSPYLLSGLLAGADYEWYIRTDCGGGLYSEWVGPDAFSTKKYEGTYNGKTTKCSPTYDRLDADGNIGAIAQYFYDKREFTVGTTGWYDMEVYFGNRDGQVHVYQTSFNPQSPAINWLGADDSNVPKVEKLYLTAGVTYIMVGVEESPISSGNMGSMTFKLYGAEEVSLPYYSDINGVAQEVSRNVPLTNGSSRVANYQCVDVNNYTHYYDDNGTPTDYSDDNILLSAKLNGNVIGEVGDGGFEVRLAGTSGVTLIQPATAPYVDDAGGWFVYNRYWKLTPTQQPTSPVNIRYYYNTADFAALQAAITNVGGTVPQTQIKTAFFKINSITGNYSPNPENGHSGVPLATSYNSDGCWIYENGLTADTNSWMLGNYGGAFYSEFKVGHFSGGGGGASPQDDNGSPLPLSLSSFYGYENGDANIIKWETVTEENTQEFSIERSDDNYNFISIAKLNAAGNSNVLLKYSALDTDPTETAYYRLRTTDFDGSFNLSSTIVVKRDAEKSALQIKQLFPNPTSGSLTVLFNSAMACNVKIEVNNMLGEIMLQKNVQCQVGGNEIGLDLIDLNSGVYLVSIENNESRVVSRVILNTK